MLNRNVKGITGAVLFICKTNPGVTSVPTLVPLIIKKHKEEGCDFFDGAESRIIANWISIGNPPLEAYEDSPTMNELCEMLAYEECQCPLEGINKVTSMSLEM